MFGFTGAHRAGKSTTAKLVAGRLGIPYFDASVSATMRERGWNTVAPMTFEERFTMQRVMLRVFNERLQNAPRPAITDRTPLDMAAYTLAELGMHGRLEPHLEEEVTRYVDDCLRSTGEAFDSLYYLRPLPIFVPAETSAPPNRPYQSHIHYLIGGLLDHIPDHVARVSIYTDDLERRVAFSARVITDRLAQMKECLARVRVN